MAEAPAWRVAIITVVPRIAQGYAGILRGLGHEPVVVITPRRRAPGAPPMPFAAEHVADDPEELDILFPATKHSLARMLRAYEVDLGLCTGFPWLIPAEALAAPPLGIVNGHPSLLPRYRGPFPLAWAVRNGEREIGLTYHLMDAEFDTGNLLAQVTIPLADDDTEETLFAQVRSDRGRAPAGRSRPPRPRRPRRSAGGRGVPEHLRGRVLDDRSVEHGRRRAPPGARLELHASGRGVRPVPRARRPPHQGEAHELDGARGCRARRVRRRPALDRRERACLMPRPTIWKPRYATRRMRERAWTRADLERERAARAAPAAPSLLARLLRVLR